MKRWAAGWLALWILFTSCATRAEEDPRQGVADLQETVVTREGEELGTLGDNIRFLAQTLQNEDVRGLLRRDDVRDLFTEVVLKTLVWLYENRPVTMKILAELGVSEKDRECVDKIWDSAERVREAAESYAATEDGQQLQQKFERVKNDPDVTEAAKSFLKIVESGETLEFLKEMKETAETLMTGQAPEEASGQLAQEALEHHMDLSTFTGRVLLRILQVMERNRWGSEYLPKLLTNENVWSLLIHLASQESGPPTVFRDEYMRLANDPQIIDFVDRAITDLGKAKDEVMEIIENIPPEDAETSAGQEKEALQ